MGPCMRGFVILKSERVNALYLHFSYRLLTHWVSCGTLTLEEWAVLP